MSAGAQTAQTFQLTCSLTGALGDDKTARPGALAKVRVQMETAALLRAELESWTVRWRRIQTRQTNWQLERCVIWRRRQFLEAGLQAPILERYRTRKKRLHHRP